MYLDASTIATNLVSTVGKLADGAVVDYGLGVSGTDGAEVGNVLHGTSKFVTWTVNWGSEGTKNFSVEARSDNAVTANDAVAVYVDGTQPGAVTNLVSTTHTPNVWSNNSAVSYQWTAATDNLSGVDGYSVFTTSAANQPGALKDIEQVTNYSETLGQGTWWFNIRTVDNSGNWDDDYASLGPIKIDTLAPFAPTGVSSPSHPSGVQQCATLVQLAWNPAVDNLGGSGVAGYLVAINSLVNFDPTGAANVPANQTSYQADIFSSPLARYAHIRTRDNAGNLSPTVHLGPFYANANSVLSYCTAKTNSLGCAPAIGSQNAPSKSAGNFTVTCANVLNQKNGLLFFGSTASAVPFQGGIKCVASPVFRGTNLSSGGASSGSSCTGTYAFTFDTATMNAYGMSPGNTVYAQWWMRDPASASTTGLSNALQFTVCQ